MRDLTTIGEDRVMMDADGKSHGGPCGCSSDPLANRVLDQAMAKYADRSAFANNAAQDGFNFIFSTFIAGSQNLAESTPATDQTQLAQLIALAKG